MQLIEKALKRKNVKIGLHSFVLEEIFFVKTDDQMKTFYLRIITVM